MLVSEVFEGAMALLNEDGSRVRVYKKNTLPLVNLLMAQCFSVENSIREAKNQQKLEGVLRVESFDDEIGYDEEFVASAFAYGLAALLCADEDSYMSNALGEEFERIKKRFCVVNFEDIDDNYA